MSDDDFGWNFSFENDDEEESYHLTNEQICEIAFFEYENSNYNFWSNDINLFMIDHLKYNIGSHVVTNYNSVPNLLHGTSILVKTFFKFPLQNILSYLKWYTYETEGSFTDINPPSQLKLHIFQLFIKQFQHEQENQYESTVILKTIWISLIQRHWKKILNKRKEIILKMKTNQFLASREINYRYKSPSFPLLKGMLSCYNYLKKY